MLPRSIKIITRSAMMAIAMSFAAPAFAHPDGSHALSLAAGFEHPFSGLDHLLAMVAIGLWAAQQRGRAFWVVPAFPLAMALGAMLGMSGISLAGAEAGIAASVTALGLLVAFAVRMPVGAAVALVSLFAAAHGYAHGAELPQGASPLLYGAGFIAATLLLHLAGLTLGSMTARKAVMRVIGAMIAAAGAYLLAGLA